MSPQEPRDAYRFLLEGGGASTTSLALPANIDPVADLDADALASLLRALFVAHPSLTVVLLKVGDTTIGAVRRGRLLDITDNSRRAVAEGDGAELPGPSMRYKLLAFTCRTVGCPAVEWHVVVPDRTPLCPNGHGPLTYRA